MGSVAAALRERGFQVSGSDENVYPPMSTFLEKEGVALKKSYRAENIPRDADVVVIDPETVGAQEVRMRFDLPTGAPRLYGGANGIDHVLVNGTEIVDHGEFTDARPGTLLRSGRDTETVSVPGGSNASGGTG